MTVDTTPAATASFAVSYIRHRADRFWVQITRGHYATGSEHAYPSAVQDPEYFIGWREFSFSHDDAATPDELRRIYASIYDAGIWEPLD